MKRTTGNVWAVVAVAGICASAWAGGGLQPRENLPKADRIVRPAFESRLVVKFHDTLRARATAEGGVRSLAGADLGGAIAVAAAQGATFRRLIDLPEATLTQLEADAAAESGNAQPDLASMLVVEAPDANLQAVADALLSSPLTEWVEFEMVNPAPPEGGCKDITPATPNYLTKQGYHAPDPGINMVGAWALGDLRGKGVKVADCEYSFDTGHEDFCGVSLEPGQTPKGSYADHGTAVLGEIVGTDNTFGVKGLAPESEMWFYSESTKEKESRRVDAITNAIAKVGKGNIVLLEMQTVKYGADYGPAELDSSVWTVVKAGTDAGVIVVAAAGNGNQDLDSATYKTYRDRGDSGAILVGAGTANKSHDKKSFSTYGGRVNVQGWGELVFTTGYGDYAKLGGDAHQSYSSVFSGTSSASPIVASACAALQSYSQAKLGKRQTPKDLRNLLIATGIPQGAGGHIGPLPDMLTAAKAIYRECPADFNGDGKLNVNDFIAFQAAWKRKDARADWDKSKTFTINDFIRFQADFAKGCK